MVLGEVAGVGLVPSVDLAAVGADVADGDLEQRRLADAVRPDHGHPLAAVDLQRRRLAANDVDLTVLLAEVYGLQRPLPTKGARLVERTDSHRQRWCRP